jgi:hypothetical protein
MRVFIDTNVFLDYIQQRPEGWKEAEVIFFLAIHGDIEAEDFEDALQYFSAFYAHADMVVTRNLKDFGFASSTEVLEPSAFLSKYFPGELI